MNQEEQENQIKQGKVIRDFTSGPIAKQLIIFSAPLFLSNTLQIVYNMVDMVVVGHYAGSAGLSAISVGGDVSNFFTMIAMAFSNAGSVIIAQLLGAKQKEKIGTFIGTLFTFLFAVALGLSVLGIVFTEPILKLMNTPAEAWNSAIAYSRICMAGMVFIYGYNIVSAVLRGLGDSKHPFMFIAFAACMNIVLDLLFVIVLNMGAAGAALATVLSQTFSFIMAIIFLTKNRKNLGIDINRHCFAVDKDSLKVLLNLGIPMALKQSSVSVTKLFVNSYINSFGVTISAVSGVGHKLNTIANLFSNATNTAGAAMVGQNIGAEKYRRVPKILVSVFTITAICCLGLGIVMYFWPSEVFALFTSDESVIEKSVEFLPVALICFAACATRSPSNALINGTANYKVNYAVAIMDGIVMRVGLSLLFGLGLHQGYLGFWYGDAFAGFTPFVIASVYYLSGKWKTRKYVVKD